MGHENRAREGIVKPENTIETQPMMKSVMGDDTCMVNYEPSMFVLRVPKKVVYSKI